MLCLVLIQGRNDVAKGSPCGPTTIRPLKPLACNMMQL
jgi:hypothetical protein